MRYAITLKFDGNSFLKHTHTKYIHAGECIAIAISYTNGQTEPNLYCQSKIIQLENQNTKPNLAFNECISVRMCVYCSSSSSSSSSFHFFDYFSVGIYESTLSSFLSIYFFAQRSFDGPIACFFSLTESIFLINFRTFVFIYLADYFYCCRFASHASFNWIPNLFFRYCSFMTHTNTNRAFRYTTEHAKKRVSAMDE